MAWRPVETDLFLYMASSFPLFVRRFSWKWPATDPPPEPGAPFAILSQSEACSQDDSGAFFSLLPEVELFFFFKRPRVLSSPVLSIHRYGKEMKESFPPLPLDKSSLFRCGDNLSGLNVMAQASESVLTITNVNLFPRRVVPFRPRTRSAKEPFLCFHNSLFFAPPRQTLPFLVAPFPLPAENRKFHPFKSPFPPEDARIFFF